MADTIKTVIPAGGGDYSSLSAWDAGQAKTVSTGNREIAECYSGVDTTLVTLSGSTWNTTASGAEVIVRAATGEQHAGTLGTGYRIEAASQYFTFRHNGALLKWTVQGLSIRNTYASDPAGQFATALDLSNPNTCVFKECLLFTDNDYADSSAVHIQGASTTALKFINCIMRSPGDAAFRMSCGVSQGDALAFNCDFIGGLRGVVIGYISSAKFKNCYLHATTAYDYTDGTVTFTTCRHSTSQSITGSTGSTAYSTANFTNVTEGSEDLSLPSGSALIDAGTDLSGDADYPFSTDILGATRSGTWEVGPFNYAAPTGGPAPKCWFDEELELAA